MIFDLDDTLTDHRGLEAEVWQQIADLIGARVDGVDPARLRERYAANLQPLYDQVLADQLDVDGFQRARLTDALAPWGEPDDALMDGYLALTQRLIDETRPAPGAAGAVGAVRSAGLRVGMLTNGLTDMQRGKLRRIGLEDAIDAFVASEQVGAPKPHAAAFAAVADALALPPRRMAMVGDNPVNDVVGALDAGFAAAVLVNHGDPVPVDLPSGVHEVTTIADAPRALGLEERSEG